MERNYSEMKDSSMGTRNSSNRTSRGRTEDVKLSATGLSSSRVHHSTASPSNTTLILLSHNSVSRRDKSKREMLSKVLALPMPRVKLSDSDLELHVIQILQMDEIACLYCSVRRAVD
ncbi:hypothetical protein ACFE04_028662 [Oxalis oulophora]